MPVGLKLAGISISRRRTSGADIFLKQKLLRREADEAGGIPEGLAVLVFIMVSVPIFPHFFK